MKPYYEEGGITIYNGDCREILPALAASDFNWTDPPYNVGKDYGPWDDNLPDNEYLDFCRFWIGELKRLNPESIAVYVPRKYFLDYWNMLGTDFEQIVLPWRPEGSRRGRFVNQFGSILTNAVPKKQTKDVWENCQMRGLGYFFRENHYGHPGYTSEDVTSRVIAAFTNPGDLIVDPFLGTGTTAFCAKKHGRKCIGIELNERDCEIAANRCRQTVMELETEKPVIDQVKFEL